MDITSTDAAPEQVLTGADGSGWSNSPHAAHAPQDEYPDIAPFEAPKPGWSNSRGAAKAITETDSKVVEPEGVEDKAVTKKTTARKAAQKKG